MRGGLCSSSPVDTWWHAASRPRLDPSALAQTIRRWHSRYPQRHLHANSCLPASTLPTATVTECHARPLHASREASTSYLAHPILPLYLYASVPNDVARNRPRRFIVRVFSLLVVYLYTTPYYFLVPAFVLP